MVELLLIDGGKFFDEGGSSNCLHRLWRFLLSILAFYFYILFISFCPMSTHERPLLLPYLYAGALYSLLL